MADEEIILELSVEANEFVQKILEIRGITDDTTKQLAKFATAYKTSFKEAAKAIIDLKKETLDLEAKAQKAGELLPEQKRSAAERAKELSKFTADIKESLAELTRADREYYKKQDALANASTKSRLKEIQEKVKAQKAALKAAAAAQREYNKITKQGYGVMSAAAQQYGQQIQKIQGIIQRTAQSSGQSWQQVGQRMSKLGVPIQQINTALQQLNTQTKQTTTGLQGFISKLGGLGNIARYVIGGSLGLVAIRVLRQLVDYFKQATQAAIDFTQSMFQLQIAVRGLQRVGVETTIKEFTDFIKELKKEFPIFSRRDITDAVALAALMTREFGFTADQIKEVVRLSTLMSIVTGKELTEAVQGATYAISAGYFEALQRVGVNITRQTISERALAAGYTETYNALDPTIRATLTLAEIVENLAALEEDAGHIANVAAGQQRGLASAWEDFTLLLGQNALPTIEKVLVAMTKMVEKATSWLELLAEIDEKTGRTTFTAGAGRRVPFLPEVESDLEDLDQSFKDLQNTILKGMEFTPEEFQEIIDATKKLADGVEEIEEESAEKRIDIMEDWARDTADIREKHNDRMVDLAQDLADKLADIDLKEQRKVADEISNNAFRVAEAIRQAAFRREDAERKYRERELRSERKFQEKLRQLRENFLLNLEDAVRERDARQIIRLTRQYNLRRTQMIREEKLGEDERKDAFKEELRQIEFQKQERLRQLAIEHQRRLEDIALQAQREREQADIDFKRREADEIARHEEERTKRKDRRDEQLTDLKDAAQDRYDTLLEALQKEFDLTENQLTGVSQLYADTYGLNGSIDKALINYQQRLLQTEALVRRLHLQLQSPLLNRILGGSMAPGAGFPPYDYAGGQAEGGTIIARKPTVAVFGEAGLEAATFTPLNKLGAGASVPPINAGQMANRSGRIRLEMLLSPDLEAKIVDNTLGEIADVNFTVERARR
jgi:hypothetical protein